MSEFERQADELEERSERLGEQIAETREEWKRKQADPGVPGAQDPETGLPPEANVTTQGDTPPESVADEREPWPDE